MLLFTIFWKSPKNVVLTSGLDLFSTNAHGKKCFLRIYDPSTLVDCAGDPPRAVSSLHSNDILPSVDGGPSSHSTLL